MDEKITFSIFNLLPGALTTRLQINCTKYNFKLCENFFSELVNKLQPTATPCWLELPMKPHKVSECHEKAPTIGDPGLILFGGPTFTEPFPKSFPTIWVSVSVDLYFNARGLPPQPI